MAKPQLEWHTLNKTNIRNVGSAAVAILAIRRDGLGYYGRVNHIASEYVELVNGDHYQNLYFGGSPTLFAVIEEPPAPSFKLAHPRLKFEGPDNG